MALRSLRPFRPAAAAATLVPGFWAYPARAAFRLLWRYLQRDFSASVTGGSPDVTGKTLSL